MFGLLDLVL